MCKIIYLFYYQFILDFNIWLSTEEESNNVQYVKARGQKKDVQYYNCNRSITSKHGEYEMFHCLFWVDTLTQNVNSLFWYCSSFFEKLYFF